MMKKAVFIGVIAVLAYSLAGYLWDDPNAILGKPSASLKSALQAGNNEIKRMRIKESINEYRTRMQDRGRATDQRLE